MSVPTGLTVSGNPITNTGTLAVSYAEGYSLPTNASQSNWDSAFGWGNHQSVGYIVGLANNAATTNNIAAWDGTTGKLLKDTGININDVATLTDVANATPNFVDGGSPDTVYLEADSFDAGSPDSVYA
jgi:hypothetical protein